MGLLRKNSLSDQNDSDIGRHHVLQWLFLTLILMFFAGSVVYDAFDDRDRILADEEKHLTTQATILASNLEFQLTGTDNILKSIITDFPAARKAGPDFGESRHLNAFKKAMPGVRTLVAIDRNGTCLEASRDDLTGKDFIHRDYFTVPRNQGDQDKLYLSPPYLTVLGTNVITLSRIIPGGDGSFDGIVGASLDPEYFRTLLASILYAPDMWGSIMHGDGLMFMMLPDGTSKEGQNLAVPGTFFTRHMASGRKLNLFSGRSYLSGQERMVAISTFNPSKLNLNKPLVIAVSRSSRKVLADWRKETFFKGFSFSVFALSLVTALTLLHRRQRRVEYFSRQIEVEKVKAEGEFQRSEEWSKTFDAVHDSICLMDKDCRIVRCNRATEDMTCRPMAELIGLHCWDLFHSNGTPHCDCPMTHARESHSRAVSEMIIGDRWFEVSLDPTMDNNGKLTGFVHVVRDITTRKKSEQVLEARMRLTEFSNASTIGELLQRTLDEICSVTNSPIGFYHFVDADQQNLTLQAWSTRTSLEFCTAAGHGSHYPISQAGVWVDCIKEKKPVVHNDYAALPHRKGMPEGHAPVIRELVVPVIRDELIVAIMGIGNKPDHYDDSDVTITSHLADMAWELVEHKRGHDALQYSEELLHLFMKNSPIYAFIKEVYNTESRVLKVSDNFVNLVGIKAEDMVGKTMHDLFPQEFADKITAEDLLSVTTQQVQQVEEVFKNGTYLTYKFPIPWDNNRSLLAGYTIDITDRRKAEESVIEMKSQMFQNEKLASIGQLAAGVAHEINNPVGYISSNLTTLSRYIEKYDSYRTHLENILSSANSDTLPETVMNLRNSLKLEYVTKDIHRLLDDCNEGIDRVQKIVSDLKTFSRVDKSSVASVDLNSCIDSTINIVWNEIKYVAELTRDFGELPHVTCNSQQLNQVFLNLLVNAAHAIQHAGTQVGTIVVRTRYVGDSVVIEISDNGSGIDPDLQKRIFEPFFTTKEIGKGTGLGLSISSEIIHKHGGELSVVSEVGVGTTFSITIPVKPCEQVTERSS